MEENVLHVCGYALWQVKVFDDMRLIGMFPNGDGTQTLEYQAALWHYDYYSFLDGSQRYPVTICPRCKKQISDVSVRARIEA